MKTFASSLASAQETVIDIDVRDVSSLAYVSSLVALEAVLPGESAEQMDFTVSVQDDGTVSVEVGETVIDQDIRETINLVASHYFQARRRNIPVSVH